MTLITTVVSHRTVEIQTDPLAPPLLVTRTALITASKAVQSSATGLANVSGRFPHGGAGLVTLDEGQISELIEDLNRAGVMSAATCDVCGHYLHGLDEMCGADHNGDMCECDGRIHYFCACGDSASALKIGEWVERILKECPGDFSG